MKLSECYSIPDHIWRDIKRYDRSINIRWDAHQQMAVIERYGQFVFSFIPTEENFNKILYTLYHTDIWRIGGFRDDDGNVDVMDRKIAEQSDRIRERTNQYWKEKRESEAREAYDYMNRVRTVPEKFAHTAPRGGMSIN